MPEGSSLIDCHPLYFSGDDLAFRGFSEIDPQSCICFIAHGHQFHAFGIADNSIIWASTSATISDGDLVIASEKSQPRVCMYTKKPSETDTYPVTHDQESIIAKVLGSFNLFV